MSLQKAQQRRIAREARDRQADRDKLGAAICKRLREHSIYRDATCVMWYIGCKSEVATLPAIADELRLGTKRTVIPYCTQDSNGEPRLGLWRLQDLADLEPGTWLIPEPPMLRRGEPGTEATPDELDLIVVPGVAFDRHGGRLGNGAGYYDRLLAQVRRDAVLCGVCYEAQLLERIEMESHDIPMDFVVTENAVYDGQGRKAA